MGRRAHLPLSGLCETLDSCALGDGSPWLLPYAALCPKIDRSAAMTRFSASLISISISRSRSVRVPFGLDFSSHLFPTNSKRTDINGARASKASGQGRGCID